MDWLWSIEVWKAKNKPSMKVANTRVTDSPFPSFLSTNITVLFLLPRSSICKAVNCRGIIYITKPINTLPLHSHVFFFWKCDSWSNDFWNNARAIRANTCSITEQECYRSNKLSLSLSFKEVSPKTVLKGYIFGEDLWTLRVLASLSNARKYRLCSRKDEVNSIIYISLISVPEWYRSEPKSQLSLLS